MDTLLPQLQVALPEKGTIDPRTLFDQEPEDLWVEVGFGGGEHLAAQAMRNSTTGFIGCEPFINGIAGLLDHLDRDQIKNVRIYPDDARHLLDALPEASVGRCYVLFSDPWPKARHADRRFIGPYSLPRLGRTLRQGALLCMATDHPKLIEHIREQMQGAPLFDCEMDQTVPPSGWVTTRYEEKGIEAGRQPVYFIYRRI